MRGSTGTKEQTGAFFASPLLRNVAHHDGKEHACTGLLVFLKPNRQNDARKREAAETRETIRSPDEVSKAIHVVGPAAKTDQNGHCYAGGSTASNLAVKINHSLLLFRLKPTQMDPDPDLQNWGVEDVERIHQSGKQASGGRHHTAQTTHSVSYIIAVDADLPVNVVYTRQSVGQPP